MLDDTDIVVLEKLKRGPAIVCPDKNAQRIVDHFANIGACKTSMVRSRPLNILTGEIMVCLTELGIQMLNTVEKKVLTPTI